MSSPCFCLKIVWQNECFHSVINYDSVRNEKKWKQYKNGVKQNGNESFQMKH